MHKSPRESAQAETNFKIYLPECAKGKLNAMFEKLKSGFKGLVTKVTTTELKTENITPILSDFKISLAENDVAFPVADRICDELEKRLVGVQVKRLEDRKKIVEENLRQVLLEVMLTDNKIELLKKIEAKRATGEPFVLLFVGINGTGKTTTIAKVAQYLRDKGNSVVLAASDTYRAGSIEQLEEHARRLGMRMIKHKYGGDPAAVAYDAISHAKAHGVNVVLIDTAGRMQTNQNLMNELAKVKRVVQPDLTVLTLDSLIGNDAVMQAEQFHKSIGVDATILTKVDADVKGGSALSVTYVTQKPILFIGVGQTYKDLELFNPEKFVNMVLR
jgi:fused signal recognition particle receptor